jgi:hypothetical protein
MVRRPQTAARKAVAVCLALAPLLVQCAAGATDTERRTMTATGGLQAKVDWALQDAAQRTRLDAARLRVALAEAVTWPDGALGCPEPGRQYAQALVSGYRIRIVAGSETLEYHSSQRGQPFFCPASRIQPPAAADPRT